MSKNPVSRARIAVAELPATRRWLDLYAADDAAFRDRQLDVVVFPLECDENDVGEDERTCALCLDPLCAPAVLGERAFGVLPPALRSIRENVAAFAYRDVVAAASLPTTDRPSYCAPPGADDVPTTHVDVMHVDCALNSALAAFVSKRTLVVCPETGVKDTQDSVLYWSRLPQHELLALLYHYESSVRGGVRTIIQSFVDEAPHALYARIMEGTLMRVVVDAVYYRALQLRDITTPTEYALTRLLGFATLAAGFPGPQHGHLFMLTRQHAGSVTEQFLDTVVTTLRRKGSGYSVIDSDWLLTELTVRMAPYLIAKMLSYKGADVHRDILLYGFRELFKLAMPLVPRAEHTLLVTALLEKYTDALVHINVRADEFEGTDPLIESFDSRDIFAVLTALEKKPIGDDKIMPHSVFLTSLYNRAKTLFGNAYPAKFAEHFNARFRHYANSPKDLNGVGVVLFNVVAHSDKQNADAILRAIIADGDDDSQSHWLSNGSKFAFFSIGGTTFGSEYDDGLGIIDDSIDLFFPAQQSLPPSRIEKDLIDAINIIFDAYSLDEELHLLLFPIAYKIQGETRAIFGQLIRSHILERLLVSAAKQKGYFMQLHGTIELFIDKYTEHMTHEMSAYAFAFLATIGMSSNDSDEYLSKLVELFYNDMLIADNSEELFTLARQLMASVVPSQYPNVDASTNISDTALSVLFDADTWEASSILQYALIYGRADFIDYIDRIRPEFFRVSAHCDSFEMIDALLFNTMLNADFEFDFSLTTLSNVQYDRDKIYAEHEYGKRNQQHDGNFFPHCIKSIHESLTRNGSVDQKKRFLYALHTYLYASTAMTTEFHLEEIDPGFRRYALRNAIDSFVSSNRLIFSDVHKKSDTPRIQTGITLFSRLIVTLVGLFRKHDANLILQNIPERRDNFDFELLNSIVAELLDESATDEYDPAAVRQLLGFFVPDPNASIRFAFGELPRTLLQRAATSMHFSDVILDALLRNRPTQKTLTDSVRTALSYNNERYLRAVFSADILIIDSLQELASISVPKDADATNTVRTKELLTELIIAARERIVDANDPVAKRLRSRVAAVPAAAAIQSGVRAADEHTLTGSVWIRLNDYLAGYPNADTLTFDELLQNATDAVRTDPSTMAAGIVYMLSRWREAGLYTSDLYAALVLNEENDVPIPYAADFVGRALAQRSIALVVTAPTSASSSRGDAANTKRDLLIRALRNLSVPLSHFLLFVDPDLKNVDSNGMLFHGFFSLARAPEGIEDSYEYAIAAMTQLANMLFSKFTQPILSYPEDKWLPVLENAIENNHPSLVKQVLAKIEYSNKFVALEVALKKERTDIVLMLIDAVKQDLQYDVLLKKYDAMLTTAATHDNVLVLKIFLELYDALANFVATTELIEELRSLLKPKAAILQSLLVTAARFGRLNVIRYLIDTFKINIHADNDAALRAIVQTREKEAYAPETVQLLLDYGANVQVVEPRAYYPTLAEYALGFKYWEVLLVLLKAGASYALPFNRLDIFLTDLISSNQEEILLYMIEHDPRVRNVISSNAHLLVAALRHKPLKFAEILLLHGANSIVLENRLLVSIYGEYVPNESIKLMMKYKVKVDDNYATMLKECVSENDSECVRILAEAGYANGEAGLKALYVAIDGKYTASAIVLINKGHFDVNANDGKALIDAVEYGNVELVRALLEAGADAHVRDDYLFTLHYDNDDDDEMIFELLDEYGFGQKKPIEQAIAKRLRARVAMPVIQSGVRERKKPTPIGSAWLALNDWLHNYIELREEEENRLYTTDEIIELMKDADSDLFVLPLRWFSDGISSDELSSGISGGNEQRIPHAAKFIAHALREHKIHFVPELIENEEIHSLFYESARGGYVHLVSYFLDEKNVYIHAVFDDAVFLAAENGHLDVVRYLLEYNPNYINIHAPIDRALMVAAKNGHLDIVRYLLERPDRSADIHAFDDAALRYAAEQGKLDVVRYLLERPVDSANIHANNDNIMRWVKKKGRADVVAYITAYIENERVLHAVKRQKTKVPMFAHTNAHTREKEGAEYTVPDAVKLPLPHAISKARDAGRSALAVRIAFVYEADLAGGTAHEYAAEFDPSLHVFLTHELGVLEHGGDDDGVVVVPTSALRTQQDVAEPKRLVIDLPFNPAAAQHAKLNEERLWALPGARSTHDYAFPDDAGRWTLPADASVSFNAYAETATQHGQACRTRAGEALFLLSELFEVAAGTRDAKDVRAEWQTTGDEPLVKGFVDVEHVALVAHSAEHDGVALEAHEHVTFAALTDPHAPPPLFHPEDKNEQAMQSAAETARLLWMRVNASLDVFFGPRAPLSRSNPAYLQHMHCPCYNTTVGMLPGSAYSLRVPRVPAPAHFYEKVLNAALLRADADPAHLLRAVEAQRASPTLLESTRYVSKLYVEMLTVYANAMVYLDDFTNDTGRTYLAEADSSAAPDASKRNGVARVRLVRRNELGRSLQRKDVEISEDYKIARMGHGDDCEGVGHEIYIEHWQFRRADLSSVSKESALGALLHHYQELARSNVYVPMLVLAGVTNKKAEPGIRDLPVDEALAHTHAAFVPTVRVAERLLDPTGARLDAKVRAGAYIQHYEKAAQPWHADLEVLIGEGTARSSAFTLPTTSYYAPEHRRAAGEAARNALNAQIALMRELPMEVVSVNVPNLHIDDPNGDVAADRVDASSFYKGDSAVYASFSRDAGVLDFAFAQTTASGGLTHGVHFNRFVQQHWTSELRLVPYNPIDEQYAGLIDSALAQLEPIPALRRNTRIAASTEAAGAPPELRKLTALFGADGGAAVGAATRLLLDDPARMPMPPSNVVLTLRAEDTTPDVSNKIVAAVTATRSFFSSARIHTHYLSDPPVRGDESALPSVVLYDIELRLK